MPLQNNFEERLLFLGEIKKLALCDCLAVIESDNGIYYFRKTQQTTAGGGNL